MNRQLNYKFQKKDQRDHKFFKIIVKPGQISASFSLQNKIGAILDQGDIGSCVSNAFAQYINMSTNKIVKISRLQHYYCGRALDGDSSTADTGLDIRMAAKIIQKYGACSESVWPYITAKFSQLPLLSVFKASRLFRQYNYTFLNQDLSSLKTCLFINKSPIIFGFYVYDSFMNSQGGIIPLPNVETETLQGGHCMVIVGYDDIKQTFTCVNSWGNQWGDKGFCYMPYAYVVDASLCSDFCKLNFVF